MRVVEAMKDIACRTIAFDDAFVKQFGPDAAEFIPDLKLVETSDAIYIYLPKKFLI